MKRKTSLIQRGCTALAASLIAGAACATDLPWVYENVDRPDSTAQSVSAVLGSQFITDLLQDTQCSPGAKLYTIAPIGFLLFLK